MKIVTMKKIGRSLLAALLLAGMLDASAGRAHAAGAAEAEGAEAVAPQLAAGDYFSLALASDGTAWSWGWGEGGRLGDGQTGNRLSPVAVTGLTGVQAVSATYYSAYALMNDGTVRAWGWNDNGQLGDGTTTNRTVPVAVDGLTDIAAVAGGPGLHALAVDTDGKVWAWGLNDSGQLGDETAPMRTTPAEVPGLSDIKAVATGGSFSLALSGSGEVWSWGWNKQGQLGAGIPDEKRATPQPIPGLTGIVAIAAGYNHALALDEDGFVWGWGQNTNGAVGDGTNTERRSPVKLAGIDRVASIAAGQFHNLALKDDGTVWAWGLNNSYHLGNGETVNRNSPVQVPGIGGMKAVAAGRFHSIAMDSEGYGWAWGYNGGGPLGDATGTSRPYPVRNKAVLDLTAPQPSDRTIAATDTTTTSVTLSWPEAADNMTEQSKLRYIPYISEAGNIDTVARAQANGTAVGYSADSSFEITGLAPGTVYSFNVLTEDRAGNRSAYTMVQASTAATATYVVRYDGNGHTGGRAPTDDLRYEQGMAATVLANTGLLTRTGYRFAGWNTAANGSGDHYPAGAPLAIASSDVTLYAQWEATPTADTEPPKVVAFGPAGGAIDVSVSAQLSLTFDEPVYPVAGKRIAVFQAADSRPVETIDVADAARVAVSGATAIIRPASALSYDTAYYVQIDADAFQDQAGNGYAGLNGSGEWTFVTVKERSEPAPSGNAALNRLAVYANGEPLRLGPAFAPETTQYSLSVPSTISSVTVTASVYDSRASASVSLYDSAERLAAGPFPLSDGERSAALPIAFGGSRIDLVVTAQDGSMQIYRIAAMRGGGRDPGSGRPQSGGSEPQAGESDARGDEQVQAGEPPRTEPPLVTVNGRASDAAVASAEETDDGQAIVVKLDKEKLPSSLSDDDPAPTVLIEVNSTADRVSVELTGDILQALRDRKALIELRTPDGSYRLPAALLPEDEWSGLRSAGMEPADIIVRIAVSKSGPDQIAAFHDAAGRMDAVVAVPPLAFGVFAESGGATVEIGSFDAYVEREIVIPDWMDPSRIATAVALQNDGTIRSVPTRLATRNGHYVAIASSLTNSAYSLVYRSAAFADMDGHWAEDAVNDMAARLIVAGAERGRFRPNAAVTRAEFAAMLGRALGLPEPEADGRFIDIEPDEWYAGAAAAVRHYGLMEGDASEAFRPAAAITREEAAAVLVRAMKLAGGAAPASEVGADDALMTFKDRDRISGWAGPSIAAAARSGLMAGADGLFRPTGELTRAEAAATIRRLLAQSGLIDR